MHFFIFDRAPQPFDKNIVISPLNSQAKERSNRCKCARAMTRAWVNDATKSSRIVPRTGQVGTFKDTVVNRVIIRRDKTICYVDILAIRAGRSFQNKESLYGFANTRREAGEKIEPFGKIGMSAQSFTSSGVDEAFEFARAAFFKARDFGLRRTSYFH
jgi:hypothetical protein